MKPGDRAFLNTLGVAQYRAGLLDEACASFEKSMGLSRGGDPYDWFFLAIIEHERGHAGQAARWFDRSVAWMKQEKSRDVDMLQAWTEAASTSKPID
jgi:hypothetical protein